MIPVLRRFIRPDFAESFADHVRDKQTEELQAINIPTSRFKDKTFVYNAFIANGRIPVTIDVISFDRKVTVITQDGEFWSGEESIISPTSTIKLQLTAKEIHELDSIDR